MNRPLIRTMVVMVSLAVGATYLDAQQCSQIMKNASVVEARLPHMYHLASLLEWSMYTSANSAEECKDDQGQRVVEPLKDVHRKDMLAAMNTRDKIVDSVKRSDISNAAVMSTGDGAEKTYHITCHGDSPDIEFVVTVDTIEYTQIIDYGADGKFPERMLYAVFDTGLIRPESRRTPKIPEEIEVQMVHSNNLNGHNEDMFLIRGTDLSSERVLSQLKTSIKGIKGDSCAFPAAAMIVRWLGESSEARVFSVAGTSLGGTTAQHVAFLREYNADGYHPNFEAYSFNGLGIPQSMAAGYSPEEDRLFSYSVKGDFIKMVRGWFRQEEVGIKLEYAPQEFLWRRGRRHFIGAVRESLCECIKGNGRIDLLDPASSATQHRP